MILVRLCVYWSGRRLRSSCSAESEQGLNIYILFTWSVCIRRFIQVDRNYHVQQAHEFALKRFNQLWYANIQRFGKVKLLEAKWKSVRLKSLQNQRHLDMSVISPHGATSCILKQKEHKIGGKHQKPLSQQKSMTGKRKHKQYTLLKTLLYRLCISV